MFSTGEILATIDMIQKQNLDVRTITMGISLRDCISDDVTKMCRKISDKIKRKAEKLVCTGEQISAEFGVPIVNKRISVTPISVIAESCGISDYTPFAVTLDEAAKQVGVNFIGGFSALVHKGITPAERDFLESIPAALAATDIVCSSVNVATTRAGINMDAVRIMGRIVKQSAAMTPGGIGAAKLVVFANAVEDNPFMAGAFHGIGEGDTVINVGVSGPGVIAAAIADMKTATVDEIAEKIKKTAFSITRVGELVAREASARLGASFGIIDLSLAPTPAVGDSVARILELIGLSSTGSHGTTAALALLNDAVKKGGIMASSHVGGLSGAFIPVSEDAGMIEAVQNGYLSIEKLEAMTSVCSVGLDMIAVPGDTEAAVISAIIADEAAIGVVNNKTTAVRIIPVPGAKVGDMVEFGGLLGRAPVMKLSECSPEKFIGRGGRIPAPIHAQRN